MHASDVISESTNSFYEWFDAIIEVAELNSFNGKTTYGYSKRSISDAR